MPVKYKSSAVDLWRTWRLKPDAIDACDQTQLHPFSQCPTPRMNGLAGIESDADTVTPNSTIGTLDGSCSDTPRSACSASGTPSASSLTKTISPLLLNFVDSSAASTMTEASPSFHLTSSAATTNTSGIGMDSSDEQRCAYSQVIVSQLCEATLATNPFDDSDQNQLPGVVAASSSGEPTANVRRLRKRGKLVDGVRVQTVLSHQNVTTTLVPAVPVVAASSNPARDFPLSQDELAFLEDAGSASTVRKRAADVVRNYYIKTELIKVRAIDQDNDLEHGTNVNADLRMKISKRFTGFDSARKCSIATELLRSLDMADPKRALVVWFYKFLQTSVEAEESEKTRSGEPFFKKKAKGFLLTWISDVYKVDVGAHSNWSIDELCVALNGQPKVLDMRTEFKHRVEVDFRALLPRYTKICLAQEVFACQSFSWW
jgi:hypothetical protein